MFRRPECAVGLRERKKQRTRDALLHAALELFTTQGYERTTVDGIVEAVAVSQRTFFRYFANKEDVLFATQDMVEARFLAELLRRPADEPPLEALRQAAFASWDALELSDPPSATVELHVRTFRMIESEPTLLAAHMRRCIAMEEEIASVIAGREGLDLDADPRPRVAVAAFSGTMRVTGQLWGRSGDGSLASLRALAQSHLDMLGPALATGWRAPAPGATGAPEAAPQVPRLPVAPGPPVVPILAPGAAPGPLVVVGPASPGRAGGR
ncbi:TetR family transcriptional regulator [Streptomyces sp. NBC_00247]|nr:TetR family transcriptional regulator [Streptomyces sp. NBC_00247]